MSVVDWFNVSSKNGTRFRDFGYKSVNVKFWWLNRSVGYFGVIINHKNRAVFFLFPSYDVNLTRTGRFWVLSSALH